MRVGRLICVLFLTGLVCNSASAQKGKKEYEAQFREKYEENIQKEYLYGRYIPADVDEAIIEVDKLLAPEVKERFLSLPDTLAGPKGVNSLGPWLLRNWNLYDGSRLSHYMKTELGLSHPVDMVYYILTLYYRDQNNIPYEKEALLSYIQERRKQLFIRQVKDGKEASEED